MSERKNRISTALFSIAVSTLVFVSARMISGGDSYALVTMLLMALTVFVALSIIAFRQYMLMCELVIKLNSDREDAVKRLAGIIKKDKHWMEQ